jgi:hypothetical protein
VLFPFIAVAGEFLEKDWKVQPLPKYPSKEWKVINQSLSEWRIFKENGKLFFDKNKRKNETQMTVNNGTLYGIDNGEFGGKLYWKSNSGKTTDEIAKGNFKQFIKYNNEIYVLEGLDHLSLSQGKIFRIFFQDKWQVQPFIDLQDAPYAAVLDKSENLYVVTSSKLLKISLAKKSVSTLYADMFWWGMYSNSIEIVNDDTLFIGMRGGIVKVALNKHEITWLIR